jgi:hypothetical protein
MDPAPVTRLVLAIMLSAIKKRARAIEMIDDYSQVRVLFLVDGTWVTEMIPPYQLRRAMIATVAGLATFDPLATSSGSFQLDTGGAVYRFDVELTGTTMFRIALCPALALV